MKTQIALIFILAHTACAPTEPPRIVDERLAPYVQAFEAVYGVKVKHNVVVRAIKDLGIAGRCTHTGGTVEIDEEFLEEVSEYTLEQVMFHELGHCTFGLDHDEVQLQGGIPRSIMFPWVFGGQVYYRDMRGYYASELGNRVGLIANLSELPERSSSRKVENHDHGKWSSGCQRKLNN